MKKQSRTNPWTTTFVRPGMVFPSYACTAEKYFRMLSGRVGVSLMIFPGSSSRFDSGGGSPNQGQLQANAVSPLDEELETGAPGLGFDGSEFFAQFSGRPSADLEFHQSQPGLE